MSSIIVNKKIASIGETINVYLDVEKDNDSDILFTVSLLYNGTDTIITDGYRNYYLHVLDVVQYFYSFLDQLTNILLFDIHVRHKLYSEEEKKTKKMEAIISALNELLMIANDKTDTNHIYASLLLIIFYYVSEVYKRHGDIWRIYITHDQLQNYMGNSEISIVGKKIVNKIKSVCTGKLCPTVAITRRQMLEIKFRESDSENFINNIFRDLKGGTIKAYEYIIEFFDTNKGVLTLLSKNLNVKIPNSSNVSNNSKSGGKRTKLVGNVSTPKTKSSGKGKEKLKQKSAKSMK